MPKAFGLHPLQVGTGSPEPFCPIQSINQNTVFLSFELRVRYPSYPWLRLWLFHGHIKQDLDSAHWAQVLFPLQLPSAAWSLPSTVPFLSTDLRFGSRARGRVRAVTLYTCLVLPSLADQTAVVY